MNPTSWRAEPFPRPGETANGTFCLPQPSASPYGPEIPVVTEGCWGKGWEVKVSMGPTCRPGEPGRSERPSWHSSQSRVQEDGLYPPQL